MKHLTLIVLTCLLVTTSFAQSTYESPHVKDGKTVSFAIPKGFYLVNNSENYGNAVFAPQEGLDVFEMNFEELEFGVLAVAHETFMEGGLEDFVEEMTGEMEEMGTELTVIDHPHLEQVNGQKCLLAAISGIVDGGVRMEAMYISATAFGDYMVVFYYMAKDKKPENLTYTEFKKINASRKDVATDREDGMMSMEDLMADEYETNFINDLFETAISYYDILPDFGDNWNETMDENSHLLGEFVYKEEIGHIAVFSGGEAVNYPSKTEMAMAIQQVFDLSSAPTLKAETGFENEDHEFNVYSISGAASLSGLYTTVVSDELVFFVIDNTDPSSTEFKAAARDFMINMWVDSEEGYEEWNEEGE